MTPMVDVALLLQQTELRLRAVHLPRPDAAVRWVATSELEDPSPFLEGGELLLTTGLATQGWRSQWNGYAERLAGSGVTSLALGVGLTHRRAPAALVRACEQHGLNLLEVPRETTFVAVSRAAVRLIEQRDESEARLALETQRQLTAAAVRDDSRHAVVGRLAQLLDGAAFLLSADGRVEVRPTGPRRQLADRGRGRGATRIRSQGLRAASTTSDDQQTRLVVPVGLQGRPGYYLAVAVPGRVTNVRRSAIATAVALLGLTVEQERDRRETRRRLRGKTYELLTRGQVDAAVVVGEASGVPALPGRVQVVQASGPEDALEDALAELERDQLLATRTAGSSGSLPPQHRPFAWRRSWRAGASRWESASPSGCPRWPTPMPRRRSPSRERPLPPVSSGGNAWCAKVPSASSPETWPSRSRRRSSAGSTTTRRRPWSRSSRTTAHG